MLMYKREGYIGNYQTNLEDTIFAEACDEIIFDTFLDRYSKIVYDSLSKEINPYRWTENEFTFRDYMLEKFKRYIEFQYYDNEYWHIYSISSNELFEYFRIHYVPYFSNNLYPSYVIFNHICFYETPVERGWYDEINKKINYYFFVSEDKNKILIYLDLTDHEYPILNPKNIIQELIRFNKYQYTDKQLLDNYFFQILPFNVELWNRKLLNIQYFLCNDDVSVTNIILDGIKMLKQCTPEEIQRYSEFAKNI